MIKKVLINSQFILVLSSSTFNNDYIFLVEYQIFSSNSCMHEIISYTYSDEVNGSYITDTGVCF